MSYAYETIDGGVATANKPPRGVQNFIEVTEIPDAPRSSWRIVDGALTFDATVATAIQSAESLQAAKQARDEALAALTYDFGDGRVMQTRPSDEQNVINAIKGMELAGLTTIQWVMLDDVKYPITAVELETARTAGVLAAMAIWDAYQP
ncbi:hypothetical protein N8314_00700 [Akkermansiaceae bacterium]|nr:hypothetical protein [Akkermansiaceae bacterium]